MWDFFQTVRHRHSVRRYQGDIPVESEKLHAILETALAAPSAGDLQAYRIVAVKQPQRRAALSRMKMPDNTRPRVTAGSTRCHRTSPRAAQSWARMVSRT